MTKCEILQADRKTLIAYLESWGFACHENEATEELRVAAILNQETEGQNEHH